MIIDGTKIARRIESELLKEVKKLKRKPSLAIIWVGENPASEIYVQEKKEACGRLGIDCYIHRLPENITQEKFFKLLRGLNKDKKINGIIIQLPLPSSLDSEEILFSIAPWKDVDGLNPLIKTNIPPTTLAIIEAIKFTRIKLKGKYVVLVGYARHTTESLIPYLINQEATITVCHKSTKNLAVFTKKADLLIVAAGRPKLIKSSMIKKGAIVIDVGINRIGKRIVGDVDFERVKKKAKFITPVPGGIGPLTVMMLIKNLIKLCK